MRTILAVIIGVITVLSALGCDNLYNGITDELNANYYHGTKQFVLSDSTAGDNFGQSVAASADGSTVVFSAMGDDTGKGSVFVYRWNGSSWVAMKLTATIRTSGDQYGYSVAVSGDGNTVVVGASLVHVGANTDQGLTYVYRWNGSSWVENTLKASDGATDDCFGSSVTVSADGGTVAVGSTGNDSGKGAVYVFQWNGSSYSQMPKLTANDGEGLDFFGSSVAVSADGSVLVAGAIGDDDKGSASGAAYVYRWNGSSYAQEQKLTASDGVANDALGTSVAVSENGSTVVVGSPGNDSNKGSVYVYRWNGSSYAQEQKLTASDGATLDYFGNSVVVSGDGGMVVVGAYGDDSKKGSAYVYRRDGSSYVQEQKLTASGGAANDNFGYSVAVSADGAVVTVGAFADNGYRGSAWLYAE